MWSRCWWATWVSGFFGIAGLLHLARFFFRIPVRLGTYDVPVRLSLCVGVLFIAISGGLLWLEVRRERAKRCGKDGRP
ncbi:MAG: hypothetical protein HYY58_02895 [Candidatus Omnitrophica bacterium]|nr:hypothetical protein [Candidatus Omnitrophota bacterium]